ncbi:hypothetical protein [Shimia aestuarii]|uniref:hypothetical protein n=1 Tax=Shimia aestuarii TaxID=254406 RepID=UPI001F61C3DD|nr:hypothetical protein [Shimia aestuarii]
MSGLTLAGCGVDGEPWTPTMGANIGISPSGVYTSSHVGASNGPISITIGGGCGYGRCW